MPDWLVPFLGEESGWKLVALLAIGVVMALWRRLAAKEDVLLACQNARIEDAKQTADRLLEGMRALDRATDVVRSSGGGRA